MTEVGALQLMAGRRVHASAKRDPDGRLFLVAFVEVTTEHGGMLYGLTDDLLPLIT